jgi:hypothetical protein
MLLMMIMSPRISLLRKMKFISQSLLKLSRFIVVGIMRIIYLLKSLLYLAIILLNLIFQRIVVQTRIKKKIFKHLRLPSHLHPYPLNFFEYLPHFSGEYHITAEKHLGDFENFVNQFEIVHEDVTMRLFFKSLFGDADLWFKGLGADSISSWTELYYAFSKYWGENKSFD